MNRYSTTWAVLMCLAGSAVADDLGIEKGIYVPAQYDCRDVPAAIIVPYDGKGLSGNKTLCETKEIKGKAQKFTQICRECTMGTQPKSYADETQTYEIIFQASSKTSFVLDGTPYKICKDYGK